MMHSVDAVVVRDGRIFAYGWAFDRELPVRDLAIRVSLDDGDVLRLPVVAGKERADVASAFPDEPHARWSGWMAYVGWDRARPKSIDLAGILEDGKPFTVALEDAVAVGRRERGLKALAKRAMPGLLDQPAGGSPTRRSADVLAALRIAMHAAGLERTILVIDHAMGGGANQYRKEWVAAKFAVVPVLAVMTFEVHTLRPIVELQGATGAVTRLVCDSGICDALADSGLFDEVFYNDAVSFPHPDRVTALLRKLAGAGARLTIAVHDYLAVCPSPFLLNDADSFCGVPSLGECQRCMRANENAFPRVQPPPDMPAWRRDWGGALEAAAEILCFSESSSFLLLRAYPDLDRSRIRVAPHRVRPFSTRIRHLGGGPLHIGVVGAIGKHKGADVIRELAIEIARSGSSIPITVFGTVEAPVNDDIVRVTGPYERDDLPGLIERSGANVFLLPSICAETFSYVTHELVALGVPLACFDLGAPADVVAGYARGRVLKQGGAAALLEDLQALRRDTESTNARGAP